jgi:uncharacterized protein
MGRRIETKPRALITGASAGIGRALAIRCAEAGHPLVLVARRAKRLEELALVLSRDYGVEVTTIPADLEDANAAQAIFDATEAMGLPIGFLVNNAGFGVFEDFAETDPAKLSGMIAVNITALTLLSRLFAPAMAARKAGRILNIASVAAFTPVPSAAVYGATKAYVLSLSEALGEELRGTGVTVTAVCPGLTDTEFSSVATGATGNALVPSFVKMSAKSVADEAYAAAMAGEAVRVNGLMNRFGTEVLRFQPRALLRRVGRLLGKQLQHGF